jgi:predicted nucleotide-binding protein (sugar kinase/HSP70/actin superfamily)
MRVTFPRLGTMHIFCKAIAETAGIPYLVPPITSRKTLALGVKNSNECICLPFKVILGNFIEALQRGADTIVMVGSGPPCRLGLYDLVHQVILKDLGLRYRWLTIPARLSWETFIKNYEETKPLRKELSLRNYLTFPHALYIGWRKMLATEYLEKFAMEQRAREAIKGQTQRNLQRALKMLDQAKGGKAIREAVREGARQIQETEQNPGLQPLRVAIVGELYTVMDPEINGGVEQRLGELGVTVTRSSWFSTHISRSLGVGREYKKERETFYRAAEEYLGYDVGAECNTSVGETIIRAQQGYDGVVHLMPFACMPETTAAAILKQVSKDHRIPVLTLTLDEQEVESRIQTLLEAFVDMLLWRREKGLAAA